ncbi:unnamed protein product [Echinostoma caproni]|uniref:PH domain-containing protein n=1 Tax=Echinostoma caproni TaxID=27848 RepID=A0A183B3Q4_9TREM|nr:unnamed protein product [Echinostoma caproni]
MTRAKVELESRVDLRNCECIVDNVEIGKWSNVFSIQTLHKDRSRVYYFAAETQELMSKWVRSLVDVTRFRRDPLSALAVRAKLVREGKSEIDQYKMRAPPSPPSASVAVVHIDDKHVFVRDM